MFIAFAWPKLPGTRHSGYRIERPVTVFVPTNMDPRTERLLAERQAADEATAALPRVQRIRAKAMRWLTRNRRSVSATLAAVLSLVIGYYALVALPARIRERRVAATSEAGRQQAQERLVEGQKLDTCLVAAQAAYAQSWDESCRALRRRESCRLPSDQAQTHESSLLSAREGCVKQLSAQ